MGAQELFAIASLSSLCVRSLRDLSPRQGLWRALVWRISDRRYAFSHRSVGSTFDRVLGTPALVRLKPHGAMEDPHRATDPAC